VWFGDGDFLKTVNLAAKAADFTDAIATPPTPPRWLAQCTG
jgi:hypothetical protein